MEREELESKIEAKRSKIRKMECELQDLLAIINKLDRAERESRREERESRQWLNEFTARQAAYHRR
jgi:Skp family chaperone for outer membrane proteins